MQILDTGAGAAEGLETYLARLLMERKQEEVEQSRQADDRLRRDTLTETSNYRKTQQSGIDLQRQYLEDERRRVEAARQSAAGARETDDVRAGLDDLMPGVMITPETRDRAVKTGAAMPERFKGVQAFGDDFVGPIPSEAGLPGLKRGENMGYTLEGTPTGQGGTRTETVLLDGKPVDAIRDSKTGRLSYRGEDITDRSEYYRPPPNPDRMLIQTGGGYMPRTEAAGILQAGGEVPLAETAATRDRKERVGGMMPVMKQMREMSRRIVTKVGPAQRVEALSRGAAAIFGNDPEFQVYQNMRQSMAVAIAVAQQGARPSDADVFRAALPMIPDPYTSTAPASEAQWELIFQMFDRDIADPKLREELGLPPQGGAGAAAPAAGAPAGDIYQEYLNRQANRPPQ